MSLPRMYKILLFTPSYNRPYMIRQQILNMKNQSYKNFTHHINITYSTEIPPNYNILFDDIIDDRFVIDYNHNSNQQTNYLNALNLRNINDYDYFIKIDDDDVYKSEYLQTIITTIENNKADIYSSNINYQLNNYYFNEGTYKNLGGFHPPHLHLKMPMTLVFNKKAYNHIKDLKSQQYEDVLWRYAWANDQTLIHHEIDNGKNLIWHIHGNNISTSTFFNK